MEDKQLIFRLQELKQIKPRKDWVLLAKSDIFSLPPAARASGMQTGDSFIKNGNKVVNKVDYSDVLLNVFSVIFQRKFAYSLAVFLFVATGLFGFMKYSLPNNTADVKVEQQSQGNLVSIKSDVEDFKSKSKSLSQIAKSNSQDISLAVKEVKDAAEGLTDAIKKDPQLVKDIALEVNNNKTYLNILGGEGELQGTLDVLYKATVEQLIKDFDRITLTENQQGSLDRIKDSFNQGKYEGKYSNALEDILLLSAAVRN